MYSMAHLFAKFINIVDAAPSFLIYLLPMGGSFFLLRFISSCRSLFRLGGMTLDYTKVFLTIVEEEGANGPLL